VPARRIRAASLCPCRPDDASAPTRPGLGWLVSTPFPYLGHRRPNLGRSDPKSHVVASLDVASPADRSGSETGSCACHSAAGRRDNAADKSTETCWSSHALTSRPATPVAPAPAISPSPSEASAPYKRPTLSRFRTCSLLTHPQHNHSLFPELHSTPVLACSLPFLRSASITGNASTTTTPRLALRLLLRRRLPAQPDHP
jgi:hypothetical protein